MQQKVIERLVEYFEAHSWKMETRAEQILFYKDRSPEDGEDYRFREYSKRKSSKSLPNVVKELKDFFMSRGYDFHKTKKVIASDGGNSPFFVTSAIQQFEGAFFSRSPLTIPKSLYAQPVIRTNYRENVGEGRISAFVNPSTLEMPCSIENHLYHINNWADFLSSQGLFLRDFVLRLKQKKPLKTNNPWTQNEGMVLSFDYGGLTLGDVGFISPPNQPEVTASDAGFGLERLLWAINKQPSFAENFGPLPWAFNPNYPYLDAIRATTLMVMSGLSKEGDCFNQFRKYLESLKQSEKPTLFEGVRYFHRQWQQFIDPRKSSSETLEFIETELNKAKNIGLLRDLEYAKIPKRAEEHLYLDYPSFIEKITQLGLSNLETIRNLTKNQISCDK